MKYAYWLANSGLSAHKLALLAENGWTAEKLYGAREEALAQIRGLNEKDRKRITESRAGWELERQWMRLQETGTGFVSMEDAAYPARLKNIHTPPYALYYKGTLPDPKRKSVAIVGARQRSAYGSQMTDKLSRALAASGAEVISGLACGIDADAHAGALAAGGSTTAVLGCGVDGCYPRSNRYLYERIPQHGCILSEYPPGTPPLAAYFPQRNRIIAGLADYTVVMEAREKSGSLITADYAMEQGREVYALPGRVTDSLSQGTNRLIQQGAGVLLSVEDFLQELRLNTPDPDGGINFRKKLLEKEEALVYALFDFDPVGLGSLVEKSPFGLSELLPVLERLEQKGFICESVPNYYVKTI